MPQFNRPCVVRWNYFKVGRSACQDGSAFFYENRRAGIGVKRRRGIYMAAKIEE